MQSTKYECMDRLTYRDQRLRFARCTHALMSASSYSATHRVWCVRSGRCHGAHQIHHSSSSRKGRLACIWQIGAKRRIYITASLPSAATCSGKPCAQFFERFELALLQHCNTGMKNGWSACELPVRCHGQWPHKRSRHGVFCDQHSSHRQIVNYFEIIMGLLL